jgi:hypothetical protein
VGLLVQAVELAFVDQGCTGETTAQEAEQYRIYLRVVKLQQARRGFGLLLRRWVGERSFLSSGDLSSILEGQDSTVSGTSRALPRSGKRHERIC